MSLLRLSLLCLTIAGACVTAQAQPANLPADILAVPKDAPPIKAVPLGRYKPVVEADASLPTHTIYRPEDLAPFKGGKLPIVAWANGACANANTTFRGFLTKIASEGFLIVAIGPKDFVPVRLEPGQAIPPAATKASQLIDAINWAQAENARKGSLYQGKLATTKVAVMGQSCGGLQAIEVGADPRIKTTVIWNSGAFAQPNPLTNATKESLKAFHSPVGYFIGGPTDIAYPQAEDDFKRISQVPVFKGNLKVGHGGTYRHPNGGWFAEVATNWLKWRLNGDKAAAKMFDGPDCGLCTDPAWSVEKRQMR